MQEEIVGHSFKRGRRDVPQNPNGGLTIVAMPGFEETAERLAKIVHEKSLKPDHDETPVDVVIPTLGLFGSGEPKVRLSKKHIGGHDVVVLTSGPGTYEMLGQLTLVLGYLTGRRAKRITVISAYFPNSRADKDDQRELGIPPMMVTAWKAVCDGKLDRIVCVDPHSDHVTSAGGRPGFVTPVRMTKRLLKKLILDGLEVNDNIVLSFPDNTAEKRFKEALPELQKELGRVFPVVFASAKRDDQKKIISRVSGAVECLPGALVIQIDDETASGGTQIDVATILQTYGVSEVWAGVTHGVLCDNAVERFLSPDCPIKRLVMIDTIKPRPEIQPLIDAGRLHILPWIDDLAWVVYNVHWDDDIRELR